LVPNSLQDTAAAAAAAAAAEGFNCQTQKHHALQQVQCVTATRRTASQLLLICLLHCPADYCYTDHFQACSYAFRLLSAWLLLV
jgi:hypothetical protein